MLAAPTVMAIVRDDVQHAAAGDVADHAEHLELGEREAAGVLEVRVHRVVQPRLDADEVDEHRPGIDAMSHPPAN